MINPNAEWFSLGIVRPREESDYDDGIKYMDLCFYGASTSSQWWLNGKFIFGIDLRIKEKIGMNHFKVLKDGEIDIYVDPEGGELKMCVVGIAGEDKEVVINGINESENKDGWVLTISFGASSTSIKARVCSIDAECYGKPMEIEWS